MGWMEEECTIHSSLVLQGFTPDTNVARFQPFRYFSKSLPSEISITFKWPVLRDDRISVMPKKLTTGSECWTKDEARIPVLWRWWVLQNLNSNDQLIYGLGWNPASSSEEGRASLN